MRQFFDILKAIRVFLVETSFGKMFVLPAFSSLLFALLWFFGVESVFWWALASFFVPCLHNLLVYQLQARIDLSGREAMTILKNLNESIVADKKNDFETLLNRDGFQTVDVERVFLFLNMDRRIHNIIRSLYLFFQMEYGDQDVFRVVLAKMDDKHIEDFVAYSPQERPRSEIDTLRIKNSTFSNCKRNDTIVIIPSILKESKKGSKRSFVVTDTSRNDEDGSIVCYPVRHQCPQNRVPYVLSVKCSRAGFFHSKEKKKWLFILESFSRRISLEHSIKLLEERKHETQGGSNSH